MRKLRINLKKVEITQNKIKNLKIYIHVVAQHSSDIEINGVFSSNSSSEKNMVM